MHKTNLMIALIILPSLSIASEEHREHGTHEHGAAAFNIVMSKQEVMLELHTPTYNVLGFEHLPHTDEQKQLVSERLRILKNAAKLFKFDDEASCELQQVNTESPFDTLIETPDHADSMHHKHEGEHGDEHDAHEHGDEHEHTDIEATYTYHCQQTVNSIDTQGLFTQFPNFERLNVQWITETQQSAQEVTKSETVIYFK